MWRTSIKPGTGQLRQAADVFQRRWRSQAQRQVASVDLSFGTGRLTSTLQGTGINPVSILSSLRAADVIVPIGTAARSQSFLDDLLASENRSELS